MDVISGNLIKLALRGEFDVIVHGCNCFCTMGAGIAKDIKRVFPEAYEADLATAKGDKRKLGTYSSATVVRQGHTITVVNAYSQFHYKGREGKADYAAIARVFEKIKADFSGKSIGYPLLGAGLAKGNWSTISKHIDAALAGEQHTLVKFNGR